MDDALTPLATCLIPSTFETSDESYWSLEVPCSGILNDLPCSRSLQLKFFPRSEARKYKILFLAFHNPRWKANFGSDVSPLFSLVQGVSLSRKVVIRGDKKRVE